MIIELETNTQRDDDLKEKVDALIKSYESFLENALVQVFEENPLPTENYH
jgi:hypothetical protein